MTKGDRPPPSWPADDKLMLTSGGGRRLGDDSEGEPSTDDFLLLLSMWVLITLVMCSSLKLSAKLIIDSRLLLL